MKYYILLFLALSIIISCSNTSEPKDVEEINLLISAKAAIDDDLYRIWFQLDLTNILIKISQLKEDSIRSYYKSFLKNFPLVVEISYVDDKGILAYVEPEEFRHIEGSDISNQEHITQAFQTKDKSLSKIFMLLEGYYGVIMCNPILLNNTVYGITSVVFKPEDNIKHLTDPIISGKVDDFFVMEENGAMIYDTDVSQIGRNVFTDELYQGFPEMIATAHTVVSNNEGKTYYSFWDKTKQKTVKKAVWWKTSDYYGNKWKFCIVKESD